PHHSSSGRGERVQEIKTELLIFTPHFIKPVLQHNHPLILPPLLSRCLNASPSKAPIISYGNTCHPLPETLYLPCSSCSARLVLYGGASRHGHDSPSPLS